MQFIHLQGLKSQCVLKWKAAILCSNFLLHTFSAHMQSLSTHIFSSGIYLQVTTAYTTTDWFLTLDIIYWFPTIEE